MVAASFNGFWSIATRFLSSFCLMIIVMMLSYV